jgi:hypothetical protein
MVLYLQVIQQSRKESPQRLHSRTPSILPRMHSIVVYSRSPGHHGRIREILCLVSIPSLFAQLLAPACVFIENWTVRFPPLGSPWRNVGNSSYPAVLSENDPDGNNLFGGLQVSTRAFRHAGPSYAAVSRRVKVLSSFLMVGQSS